MSSPISPWRLHIQSRSDYNSSATVSAICADQRLLELCQVEHTRGSSIGHDFDQGPACRRCTARHSQVQVIGLRETIDPSRESIGNCKRFFSACGRSSTSFFAERALPLLYVASRHLGESFDICAASGETNAWVLFRKNPLKNYLMHGQALQDSSH